MVGEVRDSKKSFEAQENRSQVQFWNVAAVEKDLVVTLILTEKGNLF